jgi:hypothetical protein
MMMVVMFVVFDAFESVEFEEFCLFVGDAHSANFDPVT